MSKNKIEKIGILTSGGDAPGMNAAIRAVVRCASAAGIECYGIDDGYTGLIDGEVHKIDSRFVSDTVQKGGTILRTSRCPEFLEKEYRLKAYEVLQAYGIGGLVVIAGRRRGAVPDCRCPGAAGRTCWRPRSWAGRPGLRSSRGAPD